jgi:hypothetical protein
MAHPNNKHSCEKFFAVYISVAEFKFQDSETLKQFKRLTCARNSVSCVWLCSSLRTLCRSSSQYFIAQHFERSYLISDGFWWAVFRTELSSRLAQVLTLQTCIREVLCSGLDRTPARPFMIFLIPSRRIPGECFEVDHDHFLANHFKLDFK